MTNKSSTTALLSECYSPLSKSERHCLNVWMNRSIGSIPIDNEWKVKIGEKFK